MVIESLPSPLEAQKVKVNKLSVEFARNSPQYAELKKQICLASINGPIVVFVTKMQPFSSRIYDMAVRA